MNICTKASLALIILTSAAFCQISENIDFSFAEEAVEIGDGAETKFKKPGCGRREVTPRGDCRKNYITKMDFYKVKPILEGPGKNWSYSNGIANGSFRADCHGGFIDAVPFNQFFFNDDQFRNLQFGIYADTLADVPKNGDLVLEFEASVQVFNTDQSPYPKEIIQVNDFRLGYGLFFGVDPISKLLNGFIVTNDRVYALYSRLDLLDSTWAKFSFVVPVGMRKPCDKNNVKVVYHGANKQISYRLEGKEVLRITKPGYYIDREYLVAEEGGNESGAFPSVVIYGLGVGDFLSAYPACKRSDDCCDCQYPSVRMALAYTGDRGDVPDWPQYNPIVGQPIPASYWFSNPTGTPSQAEEIFYIWGQGAKIHIDKLLVYQDLCADRKC